MEMATKNFYSDKMILAPMVRIGTLPMRLLALEYGADLVYTEEMIDKKIIGSERIVNHQLGTVDYVKADKVIFRCHPAERDRLVFQMGTADPELALQCARTVKRDVAAIDVNCGCPKRFSLQGGMGAALLDEPDRLCSILKRLVRESGLPVSCKIRILGSSPSASSSSSSSSSTATKEAKRKENLEKTIELVKRLEKTGISALAIHCRTVDQRPQDPGDWSVFEPLAKQLRIPLIANGDLVGRQDWTVLRQRGISSLMFARAAQWNVSAVFRRQGGSLPLPLVMQRYVELSVRYDMPHQNAKYVLFAMLGGAESTADYCSELRDAAACSNFIAATVRNKLDLTLLMERVRKANSSQQLAEIFGVSSTYNYNDSIGIVNVKADESTDGFDKEHFPYIPRYEPIR